MSVVFTSDEVPVRSRGDYRRHVLGEILGPLEPYGGIPDRLRVDDLGSVRVGEMTVGRPGGANRTLKHIRRSDLDVCKIDVVAEGAGTVEQAGRSAELDAACRSVHRPVTAVKRVWPPRLRANADLSSAPDSEYG